MTHRGPFQLLTSCEIYKALAITHRTEGILKSLQRAAKSANKKKKASVHNISAIHFIFLTA